jgi:hypothetical protein
MSNLLFTFILAFVVIALGMALLLIGWIITGKSRFRGGSCGRFPGKKSNEKNGCETTAGCEVCDKNEKKR